MTLVQRALKKLLHSAVVAVLLWIVAFAGVEAAPQGGPSSGPTQLVAVDAFRNITGDTADDWMGRGIAETVATGLEGVAAIRVVRSEQSIAALVVRGAYQRLAGRIRITARVIEIDTDRAIGSAVVDGSVEELFALQDQLVAQLQTGLGAATLPGQPDMAPVGMFEQSDVDSLDDTEGVEPNQQGEDVGPTPVAGLPPSEQFRVQPVRVEEMPVIDGRLDEMVGQRATVGDECVQQEPAEGEPATERTVVRFMYDAETLYVGVEAHDSIPDGIVATEMRRDSLRLFEEDNFQIIFDLK